jgi:hypothetical protein
MGWQLLTVILIVTAAGGYLLRQTWRAWTGSRKQGCGGGCGCAAKPGAGNTVPQAAPLIAPEQLTLRRRDGNSS